MSSTGEHRIGIVGLGAIGGSLALALRGRVVAWSRDAGDRAAARAAGIRVSSESGSSWVEDIASANVIVIAVPLDEVAPVGRDVLSRAPNDALVLHTASLQGPEALGLSDAEFRRVLGTHPIAGSERSGFAAADPVMFHGATVRAEERATTEQRQRIERLWRDVGATRIAWGDTAEHDALMSWVSHLPQLTATALAAALEAEGIAAADVGPGARDTTRLAASELAIWGPLLRNPPRHTLEALRRLTSTLEGLAKALERRDFDALSASWELARAWRKSVERST